jgi:hypothetical protein
MVAKVNLPLIDRGLVLHRKAHGQEGTVCGPLAARIAGLRGSALTVTKVSHWFDQ